MTIRTFRPYDPETLWLLSEDHLAYFLADLAEELNLQPILASYGQQKQRAS